MTAILDNLARVQDRIAQAARRAGRHFSDITLVAVTKTQPASAVTEALTAGATDIGENYVQEAAEKREQIASGRWHLLGHLQSNKARVAVTLFDLIQGVDSIKLARAIAAQALAVGKAQAVLLQVHLGEEETKFGFLPDAVVDTATEIAAIPGVALRGLMGIAPFGEDARSYFRQLHNMYEALPAENRQILSMGMTSDFETAIEGRRDFNSHRNCNFRAAQIRKATQAMKTDSEEECSIMNQNAEAQEYDDSPGQGGVFSRLMSHFRSHDDEEEEEDDMVPENQTQPVPASSRASGGSYNPLKRGTTLRIDQARQTHITVRRAVQTFDDARRAADGLKDGQQQIVNLEQTPAEMSERITDFLNGATYALDGSVEKIGEQVYLFTPASVIIDIDDNKPVTGVRAAIFDRD